jgi:RNase adaptor protein for sRNA GlmZ degradation
MPVIAVVGMAGSGKTTLLDSLEKQGWHKCDNIYKDNCRKLAEASGRAKAGERVVVSDVEFCRCEKRAELEAKLDAKIDAWIFFANDPQQCALNCLYRCATGKPRKELGEQIEAILRLTQVYSPPPDALPVWKCPELNEWSLRRPTH